MPGQRSQWSQAITLLGELQNFVQQDSHFGLGFDSIYAIAPVLVSFFRMLATWTS